jgi:glycosyltransferase involved in cell wall biosynthesis
MSYQSGVAAKMERLAQTAKEEGIPIDYYWLTSGYNSKEKEIDSVNVRFSKYSNPILIRIWQAKIINQLTKKYAALIIRYPLYDPFLDFIIRDKRKIITEHHTKEVVELQLLGSRRSYIEKVFGNRWINKFGGIIGVTDEILQYEKSRSNFSGKSLFIPNSIPVNTELDMSDKIGYNDKIQIIFVANFRPWHGLAKVIEGINKSEVDDSVYQLHLIGKVPDKELEILTNFISVKVYGELPNDKINELYKKMDFAIGGFNLHVKNMEEATSLKVREYFANGLPTLIGSRDPAFPVDFKYLIQKDKFDIAAIVKFVKENKGLLKSTVQESAEKYINSKYALRKMYRFAVEIV